MADRTYRWLFVALAVIGLSADQASKYGVFKWLYREGKFTDPSGTGNAYELVPGWFDIIAQFDQRATPCDCGLSALQTFSAPIMPRVNQGALFGIGQGQNGLFALVSVVAALGIVIWAVRKSTAREKGLMAALGLILGGTIGNLYDRILFGGVRDFLYFHHNSFEWPVFNIADCCLVVGATLLLVQALFFSPKTEEQAASPTTTTTTPTATTPST